MDRGEWVSTFGSDAGFTQFVYNHRIDDEFRQVDTNNDGKVQVPVERLPRHSCRKFDHYDLDGDGVV